MRLTLSAAPIGHDRGILNTKATEQIRLGLPPISNRRQAAAPGRCRLLTRYRRYSALNELPQPQVETAFGFSTLKPAPIIVST